MSMHPDKNYFAEFKKDNRYFVETGSYRGDGIQLALEAGYEKIRSIDISHGNILFCSSRFALPDPKKNIRLHEGDSAVILGDLIADINEPITFWLDSHWQMTEDEPKGENPFPLLKELEQIAQHNIKTHTILIDDILYMTHPDITGWKLSYIKKFIKSINNDYKFDLLPNPVFNNLLIVHL
jgi:hypothetical protein